MHKLLVGLTIVALFIGSPRPAFADDSDVRLLLREAGDPAGFPGPRGAAIAKLKQKYPEKALEHKAELALWEESVKKADKTLHETPANAPSASGSRSKQPVKKQGESKRRMSPAECRLMSREVPSAARRLGSNETGIRALQQEIEQDSGMTEPTGALIGYLVMYRSDDLRAFSYEMASDFERKCLAGTIRAKL